MSVEQIGNGERWIFVIDTDTYGGGFERELTAYCTGEIGQCEVGDEEAEIYRDAMGIAPALEGGPFFEQLEQRADDHGCYRPTYIFPNPNWVNDGSGNHYRVEDWDPAKVLEKYKQTRIDYAEQYRNSYADQEYGNNEADRKIAEYNALTVDDLHKWPAYNSVAIFFEKRPTDEQVRIIKERAQKFVSVRWNHTRMNRITSPPAPTIEGFRLVREVTTLKEEPI
jgi:hypothetical protein